MQLHTHTHTRQQHVVVVVSVIGHSKKKKAYTAKNRQHLSITRRCCLCATSAAKKTNIIKTCTLAECSIQIVYAHARARTLIRKQMCDFQHR